MAAFVDELTLVRILSGNSILSRRFFTIFLWRLQKMKTEKLKEKKKRNTTKKYIPAVFHGA